MLASSVPQGSLRDPSMVTAMQILGNRQIDLGDARSSLEYLGNLGTALASGADPDLETATTVEAQRLVASIMLRPAGNPLRGWETSDQDVREHGERMESVISAFRRIANRFPAQASIDSFEPTLAQALAWEDLAFAFYRSYSRPGEVDRFEAELPSLRSGIARPAGCGSFTWKRNRLRFPSTEAGYNGAVMVGFHFDDGGKVTGQRVLAEVPARKFGDTVVRQMRDFEADLSGLDTACQRDHLYFVQFYSQG